MKSQTMHRNAVSSGFTLVELIVVITILGILWTIGFMSFNGYVSSSRDTKRTEDLAMLVSTFGAAGAASTVPFPAPDDAFTVTWSGGTLWKQGKFGKSAHAALRAMAKGGISSAPTDPSTGEPYAYSVDGSGRQFQLMAIAEGDVAYSPIVETAYAADAGNAVLEGNFNGLFAKAASGSALVPVASPSLFLSAPSVAAGSSVDAGSASAHSGFVLHARPVASPVAFALKAIAASMPRSGTAKAAFVQALAAAYSGASVPAEAKSLPAVVAVVSASASSSSYASASVADSLLGNSPVQAAKENADLAGGTGGEEKPPAPAADPCTTKIPGADCTGGAKYAFESKWLHYMVTPGGCTDSASPTCAGGTDAVTKNWNAWGDLYFTEVYATSTSDGKSNTETLLAADSNSNEAWVQPHLAAKFCADMSYGGFDDWFLPSSDKLLLLYDNRAAISGFGSKPYWSSTEYAVSHGAWYQNFTDGSSNSISKGLSHYVRCIRQM